MVTGHSAAWAELLLLRKYTHHAEHHDAVSTHSSVFLPKNIPPPDTGTSTCAITFRRRTKGHPQNKISIAAGPHDRLAFSLGKANTVVGREGQPLHD